MSSARTWRAFFGQGKFWKALVARDFPSTFQAAITTAATTSKSPAERDALAKLPHGAKGLLGMRASVAYGLGLMRRGGLTADPQALWRVAYEWAWRASRHHPDLPTIVATTVLHQGQIPSPLEEAPLMATLNSQGMLVMLRRRRRGQPGDGWIFVLEKWDPRMIVIGGGEDVQEDPRGSVTRLEFSADIKDPDQAWLAEDVFISHGTPECAWSVRRLRNLCQWKGDRRVQFTNGSHVALLSTAEPRNTVFLSGQGLPAG